ncbi:hypothetical protein [Pseudomonas aegrilactucae]|uniref:Uncharacterized protein n=1 Tax=Pseudomonas aegrilactucae TaxID=2854028 RepID=A0A9Q2XJ81_9PSED|nr:hypothetical protein [Pseudomonas aegrilactucae]MBV6288052.1 hypothetical protein [Pseudomonas aegrilactucae]
MSLTMGIFLLIGTWLVVAAAMLWGVLRIARRHHLHHPQPRKAAPAVQRHANAH